MSQRVGIPCRTLLVLMAACAATGAGCDESGDATNTPSRPPSPAAPQTMDADPADATDIALQPATDSNDSSAASFAPAAFATVLTRVVTDDGRVRYSRLREEQARQSLDAAIDEIANASPPAVSDAAACKALWINAFNANALRMAFEESRKEGFKTVNDVPGFFDQRTITVAGEAVTLDALRERLRGFKDPRIHAALVCACRGSPPLRNEPFAANRIDAQLDDQSLQWLDNYGKNRATPEGLRLSAIFDQYAADFEVEPYQGSLGFVRKHARPRGSLRDFVRSTPNMRITPLEFDWTLNDATELP